MALKVVPGTRDERWGPSSYCTNPECEHREWQQAPPQEKDPNKPDWKDEQYAQRKQDGVTGIVEITPQISLGDVIDGWLLRDSGTGKPFDAILNVSQKGYDAPPDVEYSQIPLTEYGSKPGKKRRRETDFARAVEQLEKWLAEGKKVFVHCVAGANRSVSVIMAALMGQGMSYPQALQTVRINRPIAYPHGEIDLTLRKFVQDRGSAKESASLGGGQYESLQPMARRVAADDAAEFVSYVDWALPFEDNYARIEQSSEDITTSDPGEVFFEPDHTASERFIQSDILMDQALADQPGITAAKKKDTKTRSLFKKDEPEFLSLDEHPSKDIKYVDPKTAHEQMLSRRGLKLPAPDVFNAERYQQIYQKAPMVPLSGKDPRSVDKALRFLDQTKGLLMGHKREKAGEYFLVPTKFGNLRADHVAYAAWFSIFSANTSVQSEETSFVLWQAGKSGNLPGRPGIMSKKPKIKEWLMFLKWAGFPTFKNLYKTLEGFDPSDESYERRLLALSRLPGMQMKVASFFLALMGDTRSPTLDMHALGYLIQQNKIDLPEGAVWHPLSELAEENAELRELARSDMGTKSWDYKLKRMQYEDKAENNKNLIAKIVGKLKIKDEPPKTKKGLEAERLKVREYMRRQFIGWDGDTNNFWQWYANNEYFSTHEPRRDMIHSVFFQSLFPELFTPLEMAKRDELFDKYSDPELVEEREPRMRYRDFAENLERMRKIQPRKVKPVAPAPTDDFDWETGESVAPAQPVRKKNVA